MARRIIPSTAPPTDLPLRLADVDVVSEAADDAARFDGGTVAALLDVVADPDRLLDPEGISLELEHVADLLAALAESTQAPTSGALSLAERCVRRLAGRVDGLRPGARARGRRFVITTTVREVLRDYGTGTRRPRCRVLEHRAGARALPAASPTS